MSTEDKKEEKIDREEITQENWEELAKEITNEDGSINEDVLSPDKISYIQTQTIGYMQSLLDTYSMHATKSIGMLQLTVTIITAVIVYFLSNRDMYETHTLIVGRRLIVGFGVSALLFGSVVLLKNICIPYHPLERYFVEEYDKVKSKVYRKDILFIKLEDIQRLYDSINEVKKVNGENGSLINLGFIVFFATPFISVLLALVSPFLLW